MMWWMKDLLTHLKYHMEFWLEAKATDRPNKNQVYNISITTTQDIRSGCSVLTINTPQPDLGQPSPAFH